MLDQVTKLEKVTLNKNTVTLIYEIINLRQSDLLPNFSSVIKESLIKSNQESGGAKLMLSKGVVFKHVYNLNDESVAEILIDESML